MSTIALVVAVMAVLAGMSLPVGAAHYGRSAVDRLRPRHLGLLVLAIAALGTAGMVRFPIGEAGFPLVALMSIYGLYLGSVVLILYGVLKRLVRPVVAGLRSPDTDR